MEKIGMIAGSGNLPVLFAQEAKKKQTHVIAIAIKGITDDAVCQFADKVHWIDPAHFNVAGFLFTLVTAGLKKMVMMGKIDKALALEVLKNNKEVKEVLNKLSDERDYSILDEVTKRLGAIGVKVVDGLDYMGDLIAQKGILTKRAPTQEENADIEYGIEIARKIADYDIGQTVAIKNRNVLAIEGMEGTDAAIRRAGDLAHDGFVIVKMARPKQDMRWDVPIIGESTIKSIIQAGGTALAMESDKMFFIEREPALGEADRNNICIIVK